MNHSTENQSRVEAGRHLWRLSSPKDDQLQQVVQGLVQSGFRGEADKYIHDYGRM